jgi:hypothetical protein
MVAGPRWVSDTKTHWPINHQSVGAFQGNLPEVQVPLQEGARIDFITGINKVVHRLIL